MKSPVIRKKWEGSARQGSFSFMSKTQTEDLLIPPHPTHRTCNLILITLYSFGLKVTVIVILVEENFRRLHSK